MEILFDLGQSSPPSPPVSHGGQNKAPKGGGPEGPKFSLFFPSPAPIFVLLSGLSLGVFTLKCG